MFIYYMSNDLWSADKTSVYIVHHPYSIKDIFKFKKCAVDQSPLMLRIKTNSTVYNTLLWIHHTICLVFSCVLTPAPTGVSRPQRENEDKLLWHANRRYPENHTRCANAYLMLAHRLRRWSDIKPTLVFLCWFTGSQWNTCGENLYWQIARSFC